MPPTPERAAVDDRALSAGFDRAWTRLTGAVSDRASGLRLPVVATVDDGVPDARVMVLRAADRATSSIVVYSDRRAPKIDQFTANPRVAVVGYDTRDRLQLRLHGVASVLVEGATVDSAWNALGADSRLAYRSFEPPGTTVAALPLAAGFPDDEGRANFALVTIILDRIEWLDLVVPGHRRALHVREGAAWRSSWLVP